MVSLNNNYTTNTYAMGMMNTLQGTAAAGFQGDAGSAISIFMNGSIDSIGNAAAENCRSDVGKSLIQLGASILKLLLSYVIGQASKEATNLHNETSNIENNGSEISNAVVDATNQELSVKQGEINRVQNDAKTKSDEILELQDETHNAIDEFQKEQDINGAQIKSLANTKQELLTEKDTYEAQVKDIESQIKEKQSGYNAKKAEFDTKEKEFKNIDKSISSKQKEIDKKQKEIDKENEKIQRAKEEFEALKNNPDADPKQVQAKQQSYNNLLNGNIQTLRADLGNLNNDLTALNQKKTDLPNEIENLKNEINTYQGSEVQPLQEQIAAIKTEHLEPIQSQIIDCNNRIRLNTAQLQGQQESLVNLIEQNSTEIEGKHDEFNAFLSNITQLEGDYNAKKEMIQQNLDKFGTNVKGVTNEKLAEQLLNGTTYQAMGTTAESAATAESLTPITAPKAAEEQAKALDLLAAALKSVGFSAKDTAGLKNMTTLFATNSSTIAGLNLDVEEIASPLLEVFETNIYVEGVDEIPDDVA